MFEMFKRETFERVCPQIQFILLECDKCLYTTISVFVPCSQHDRTGQVHIPDFSQRGQLFRAKCEKNPHPLKCFLFLH